VTAEAENTQDLGEHPRAGVDGAALLVPVVGRDGPASTGSSMRGGARPAEQGSVDRGERWTRRFAEVAEVASTAFAITATTNRYVTVDTFSVLVK
jgi:hypothetical protein